MSTVTAQFSLMKGSTLTSDDKSYTLLINDQGKAEVRQESDGTIVWQSGGTGGSELRLQTDSNLVLYDSTGKALWASDSYQDMPGTITLTLTNDGYLVVNNNFYGVSTQAWKSSKSVVNPSNTESTISDTLSAGNQLCMGQYMVSQSGNYSLGLSNQNGLVLKDKNGNEVWNLGLGTVAPDHLSMQGDKNLVLYDANGNALWATNSIQAGVVGNIYCKLDDTGEFSTHNDFMGDIEIMWSSGSEQGPGILSSGGSLSKGQSIKSPSGQYTMTLNTEGKLVITGPDNNIVWMPLSGIPGVIGDKLEMQHDGNLVMSQNGNCIWATNTVSDVEPVSGILSLKDDGTLTISNRANGVVWQSKTYEQQEADRLNQGRFYSENPLTMDQYLQSPGKNYTLWLSNQNGLILKDKSGNIVWNLGLGLVLSHYLAIQNDKNFVLYQDYGKAIWASNTSSAGCDFNPYYCQLDDTGEFTTYGGSTSLWSSGSIQGSDILSSGAVLKVGQSIKSSNGKYTLSFDKDGKPVLTDNNNTTMWYPRGNSQSDYTGDTLQMGFDGALKLLKNGTCTWKSESDGYDSYCYLQVQDDGILAIISKINGVVWKSKN